MTGSRIAFVDIETAPSLGYVWGKWEQNVIDFKTDWYMLSYAVKWVGEKRVTTRGLCDYPGYKKNVEDDSKLVADLWKVFDEADVLIAHNGDRFDIVKANTRFILHKLPPPSPYKTVDTLKIARKAFKFDSNKLDDLGHYFGIGRKLPNTGFHLWRGCMLGDKKSWSMMKRYNSHDVVLLEKLYYLIRAWSPTHPNINKGEFFACPTCASKQIHRRGDSVTHCFARNSVTNARNNCHRWWEGSARKVE